MSDDICDKLVRFNERKECVSTNLEVEAAKEITRLREENARLREALMPFVQRLEVLEETIAHKYAIGTDIDVAHLRAARAVIREGGKDEN